MKSISRSFVVSVGTAVMLLFCHVAIAQPVGADWITETTGTLNGVSINLSNVTTRIINANFPFTGADFAAAPLSAGSEMIEISADSDWQATFSAPLRKLNLYIADWRGNGGGPNPVVYTFSRPFIVLSGLTEAAVTATTLTAPEFGGTLHSGIIQFVDPITSLSVDSTGTLVNFQGITFGIVEEATVAPEPGTAVYIAIGMALLVGARIGLAARRGQETIPVSENNEIIHSKRRSQGGNKG